MKISGIKLFDKVKHAFKSNGCSEFEASICAEYILFAEFRNIQSHGLRTLDNQFWKYQNSYKKIKNEKEIKIIKKRGLYFLKNNNYSGIVAAKVMTNFLVKKALEKNVAIGFVPNANSFFSASYYSYYAALKDCACFVCANTTPLIKTKDSLDCVVGSNPFSFSYPGTKNNDVFCIDSSCATISKSYVQEAFENKLKLCPDLAIDKNGETTTNPQDVLDGGGILPFGGIKGLGIAISIDLICGLLSGSGFLNSVNKFYKNKQNMNCGQFFVLIKKTAIECGSVLNKKYDNFIEELKNKNCVIPGSNKSSLENYNELIGAEYEVDKETISYLDSF